MKIVVMIYSGDDWMNSQPYFSSEPAFQKGFEKLFEYAKEFNVIFYRASIDWYDPKKKHFKKMWSYTNGTWKKKVANITPDAIFDKTQGNASLEEKDKVSELSTKIHTFGSPLFRSHLDSKLSQYLSFGDYMPKTVLIHNKAELKSHLPSIPSTKVVTKPLQGSGGFGIFIENKKQILSKKLSYPLLLQETVTNSSGVRHISQKGEVADLRLIFINHKLIYALSRKASKSSLFTNFHQGAEALHIPNNKIPKEVLRQSREISKKLKIFPNSQYSLDFMFGKNSKPYLIELNSVPGIVFLHLLGDNRIKKSHIKSLLKGLHVL